MIDWSNLATCRIDRLPPYGYNGFGLRFLLGHGTWIRSCNLMNCPRIALDLKYGKSKRVVFSTRSPEQIIEIAKNLGVDVFDGQAANI